MKKNKLKKLVYIFLFFISANYYSQTVTPQVINSAGGNWQLSNGITISDNVGEPFVSTISSGNTIITQGFLQNYIVSSIFSVSIIKSDVSCKDQNDGSISVIVSGNGAFSTQYTWLPQSVCPLNNCNSADSLKPGTYTVSVKVTYTVSQLQHDTIFTNQVTINDNNNLCKVKIYSGITPNGDGINDVFTIDNINEFPNNHLLIYNRWGQLMHEEKGYDNITKVWPQKDGASNLISSTYFYILYLGDGSSPIKGWVELIKN